MKRLVGLALGACMSVAPFAGAQDYEREQRWASQIVPSLVVGDAVTIKSPGRRDFLGIYTETSGSKTAVLLVHGVGVHPDHGVIGVLRASLAESGLTTLSIQMPVAGAAAKMEDYYPALFPDAVERIRAGAHWLADKGHRKVVLLSHSMGSWMSNVYFEQTEAAPFAAWINMGLTGGFGSMGNVKAPVLDLYGEHDLPQVTRADWRRRFALRSIEGSKQVMIAGADHHYTGHEKELARVISEFIGGLR
jgi:alpha/beta superfamily hydrolase